MMLVMGMGMGMVMMTLTTLLMRMWMRLMRNENWLGVDSRCCCCCCCGCAFCLECAQFEHHINGHIKCVLGGVEATGGIFNCWWARRWTGCCGNMKGNSSNCCNRRRVDDKNQLKSTRHKAQAATETETKTEAQPVVECLECGQWTMAVATLDTPINQAICLINVQLRTFRCNLF